MNYIRESSIKRHLLAQVKAAGGTAYKFTSPWRRSVPNSFVLLPGGRAVFVECKAPGDSLGPIKCTSTTGPA